MMSGTALPQPGRLTDCVLATEWTPAVPSKLSSTGFWLTCVAVPVQLPVTSKSML